MDDILASFIQDDNTTIAALAILILIFSLEIDDSE